MSILTNSTQIIPSNSTIGHAMENASGAVHRATDSVSDAAHSAYASAASGARHAAESVNNAARHVAASVESGGQQIKQAGKRLDGGLRTQLNEHPFTSVAVAIGAGFLISWMLRPR